MEKSRRGGDGVGREREDGNIYLAASTVLKTTVVHFAELPRGTTTKAVAAEAVTADRGTRDERESEKKKKERTERRTRWSRWPLEN